jgi:hypothetical protein
MQKHWATISKQSGLDKRFMQHRASCCNKVRRIVAPKVAGSSPVGHPSEEHPWGRAAMFGYLPMHSVMRRGIQVLGRGGGRHLSYRATQFFLLGSRNAFRNDLETGMQ